MSSAASRYRKASHAGSWYTNDGKQLDNQLGGWLTKAGKQQKKGARAIIAPHAGFSYSGPTAAYAYKEIDPTNIRRVFILGPSHHVYLKGCALSRTTYYQTPLYDLTVDGEMNDELHSTGHFEWMSIQTDEDEHSIEMHLPYIAKIMQSKRDAFTVVPVLVGSLNRDRELMYGDLFSKYLNDSSNLFVISSDFCHWGKRFSYSFYEESHGTISQHIEHLDRMGMNLIEKLDSEAFHNYLKQYKNTICGRHPISVLLCAVEAMKRKFSNGHVLEMKFSHYAQSNAATSRSDSSVSYAAGSLTLTD